MRSHIDWGRERSILYKSVETSPYQTHFKTLEGKFERESLKGTISASGGLEPLKMTSKPPVRRLSLEGRWTKGGVPVRMLGLERRWIGGFHTNWRKERMPARILGPKGGWIVKSRIGWGGERIILSKSVETSPQQMHFKNLEGNLERKSSKRRVLC